MLIEKLFEYLPGPGDALVSSSKRGDFPILEQKDPLNLELK